MGFRGRLRLAESLLLLWLAEWFKKNIAPLETEVRLPELATAISGVQYPSWWIFIDDTEADVHSAKFVSSGNNNSNSSRIGCRRLELIEYLAGATIGGLEADANTAVTVDVGLEFIESLLHFLANFFSPSFCKRRNDIFLVLFCIVVLSSHHVHALDPPCTNNSRRLHLISSNCSTISTSHFNTNAANTDASSPDDIIH